MRSLDEVAEHGRGDFEVGDHPVFHRADGDDVARGSAEHLLRLGADRFYLVDAARIAGDRNDAGLGDDDALSTRIDHGVGRAEVDCEIVGEPAEDAVQDHIRLLSKSLWNSV